MAETDKESNSSRESSASLTRSAGLVGLLTLASRVLGLLRDAVVAAFFKKRGTDAFFVAFTIPNVLRRLLAEGSLTVAFIPVFTEYRERHGEAEARQLVQNTLGVLSLVLLGVTALGIWGAPWVVRAFAYGLTRDPENLALATQLTRVVFPYLITVGLTALAMGVLNTYRHFTAPAVAPVALNICIIGAVVLGSQKMVSLGWHPTVALAGGAVLGGLAQLLLQQPFLRRHGMLVLPRFDVTHPGVGRIARLMAPSLFALAIYQINVMLARQFASFLPEGSISFVYYAQRLIEFPIGIFAVALATVSMPTLSSHATAGDMDKLKETFSYSLRMVFFVLLPAMAGLAALALPLTATLFQRGEFDHDMARQTAWTLMGFICGLWAAGGVRQAVQVFYALQDTRTPVKVSALCLVVFASMAYLLYRPLGTFGLALSVSTASAVNFLLLTMLIRRRIGPLGLSRIARSAAKAAIASAGCGGAAFFIAGLVDWSPGGRATSMLVLAAAVVAGVAVYVLLCLLLRVGELSELARTIRRRGPKRDDHGKPNP